ncbi:pentatricopeptide repeat-containing protein At1g11900-like isoform X1 [Papaver somniferum]|uniref:pentatricopeptide repeat-containing protein At1g11900-like isoform X1 n=1 Tax=Papaver somniferum TaxID=3469 RepID=UPI000E6FA797|nr:pentatricopeptide repeat-containing protein At1g11900-like isoform X1 [Papaver somniferum]
MSKIRHCLGISVSNCCISSVLFCSKYFSTRRVSSFTKISNHTSKVSYQKYIKSLPLRFGGVYPFFSVISISVGDYQYLSTQTSPGEHALTEEDLNRILSEIEKNPILGKEACHCYIEKLSKSSNLLDAVRLLQSLRDKQVFLFPKTYNILLIAVGEGNHFELLSQIFKDLLISSNFLLGQDSYSNLAKAFLKSTDTVHILQLVKEVSELTFQGSATVMNRIISSFDKSGQIDTALLIFDHMKDLKCKPDTITFNTVLAILGRAGRVDELLHQFSSMKETNMVPDVVSYNTLITSLRKLGRMDLCLVFVQEMCERGLKPDLRTYTALIEGFGRLGHTEEALRLLGDMKTRGVCPSIYIYRGLISNLKKIGKFELAINLEAEINSSFSDLIGPKDFKRSYR